MRHGYTNRTEQVGATVRKQYQGPDAAERQAAETTALTFLSGRFPVPGLVESGADGVVLDFVAGVPGQEVLERAPHAVLAAVGRSARRLHELDVTGLDLPVTSDPTREVVRRCLVHGDFGPQNLIVEADGAAVAAVVDWELAHLGDPVIDLAWPEWIVRTHHPHLAYALPALFVGYGTEPVWAERREAMLAKCRWAIDFVTRWSGPQAPGVATWRERLAATAAFSA